MEIMPPSFTGDPNSARSDESAFKFPWMCMNAALLYNRFGFHNHLSFGPSVNGDYLLAMAEEKRAAARGRGQGQAGQAAQGPGRGVHVQAHDAVAEGPPGAEHVRRTTVRTTPLVHCGAPP